MDIGLIFAAATQEPGLGSWILWRLVALLGVGAGLTFVIFVHELGHFLVAKACGVKCEKFYVGFDFFEIPIPFTRWRIPRSLVKFQWGETEYGIGSLPLGGYVKMLGQDDDPTKAEAEAARTKIVKEGDGGQPAEVVLDPRSYPAQSVPARMAIISAGVIMNLIFAVILAAVAYGIGVRELPATIGATAPGSPAWTAGIVPGSKIRQMGRRGQPYDNLRFDALTTAVVLNGYDRDLPLLIRKPNGEDMWYDIRPSDRLKAITDRPTVGVVHEGSREVAVRPNLPDYLKPITKPALKDKDRVLEIDGQPMKADWDVAAALAQKPFGPVTLKVERGAGNLEQPAAENAATKKPEILEVTVEARPMRGIGAAMEIGPVVAIRKGSPAEDAGFKEGDRILAVNGEPVGDPLSLPERLVPRGDSPEPIEFLIERKDRERTLTVHPEPPLQFNNEYLLGGPVSIESVGVAYAVTARVASVESGSPAEKAGLQPGDLITQAEFLPAGDKQREEESKRMPSEWFKPIVIDGNLKSWTMVFTRMQYSLPDTQVKLTWTRDGKQHSETVAIEAAKDFFDQSRGLTFYSDSQIHIANSVGDALRLGLRETVERVLEVVFSLYSLVTGRVSATNLMGPAGIIAVASSFASEGFAKLLLFLTMLSANLAVLNFLPIPALDGGHMLFLAAEGVRGKPVDERLQIRLTIVGVVCLLSLMVFATAMDIGRFAELIQEWLS